MDDIHIDETNKIVFDFLFNKSIKNYPYNIEKVIAIYVQFMFNIKNRNKKRIFSYNIYHIHFKLIYDIKNLKFVTIILGVNII